MKKDRYIRKGNDFYGIELSTNRYNLCTFSIQYRAHSRRNWSLSIGVPFLFYFYFKVKGPKLNTRNEMDVVDLSFHNASLHWKFWTEYGVWKSSTPKYQQGSFDFQDFFLGKSVHLEKGIWYGWATLRLPEGCYQASVKTWTSEWRRPRWYTKRLQRIEFSIKGGIPVEGKGENSWDCGMDAVFSSCFPMKGLVEDAANELVNSMMQQRDRRGGTYTLEALAKDGYYVDIAGFITRDMNKSHGGETAKHND